MKTKNKVYALIILLVCVSGLAVFTYIYKSNEESRADSSASISVSVNVTASPYKLKKRTKTANCKAAAGLPDPACTPGAVRTYDLKIICSTSTANKRNLTVNAVLAAYSAYRIQKPFNNTGTNQKYEVDRLVPLELGGADSMANLWPQTATPTPGFREKNKVEKYLHDQVCSGKMPIDQAQFEIANNWIQVYKLKLKPAGIDSMMHKLPTTTESTIQNQK